MRQIAKGRWMNPGFASAVALALCCASAFAEGQLAKHPGQRGSAVQEELYGTWRLASYTQTIPATGVTTEILGKSPTGFVTFGRDRRMMLIIVRQVRPKPADLAKMSDQERSQLFRTMLAYGGTYEVGAATITSHLDISWNEIWTGTDQVRNFRFDGRKLILSTNPQPRSLDGEVAISVATWEKLE